MFTGIIEEIGKIKSIKKGKSSAILEIAAEKILEDVHLGDSIAVNGVCLTVTSFGDKWFKVDVMHESMNRSSLSVLRSGSHVNLERAMAANGRFGGHIVSGHVDGMGTVQSVVRDDNAVWYTIKAAPAIMKYIVEKGSITIDGISLTVAKVTSENFAVSIIPHTLKETILAEKRPGDVVNLENDMIGKYVERFVTIGAESIYSNQFGASKNGPSREKSSSGITMDFLIKNGF